MRQTNNMLKVAATVALLALAVKGLRMAQRQTVGFGQSMRRLGGGVTSHAALGVSLGQVTGTIDKRPGDDVTVSIQWATSTVNAAGTNIAWPYVLIAALFRGSSNIASICGPSTVGCALTSIAHSTLIKTQILTVKVPASAVVGETLEVRVALFGARSNPDGIPVSLIFLDATVLVPFVTALTGIKVVAAPTPAVPGGSIGDITVSQRLVRGRYANSPGPGMRR